MCKSRTQKTYATIIGCDKIIINSLLDTDLYKFTMQQVVFHKFPDVDVEYEFKLRNYEDDTLIPLIPEIREEIKHLCTLRFTNEELDYLNSLSFISKNYVEFLRLFQLNPNYIEIHEIDNEMKITIKGSWLNTILFEVPILAIVSEVFTKNNTQIDSQLKNNILFRKVKKLEGSKIKFADFGTRRRHSLSWQEDVIEHLLTELPNNFIGTSNVMFAKQFNIKPIGTMAHEYFQGMQALVRLRDSQKFALENWVQEYRGDLGIALSDTLGMDAFLKDFDLFYVKLFDGARHDSGDPYIWCRKLINHYQSLGVDPQTKTAVFSDGLDFDKAITLYNTFHELINVSFGIGTYLTNDTGTKALQIVIKMTECNGQPVAKISDSPGKLMCKDKDYLKYLMKVFDIKKDLDEVNEDLK